MDSTGVPTPDLSCEGPACPELRRAEAFVFCETRTGTPRFRVRAGSRGQLPVEEAASLLAMHCLIRGQSPRDYTMLVAPRARSYGAVTKRAEKLLQAAHTLLCPVPLRPREREVLDGILRDLSNKEIAAQLRLSERTVKFHVSTLLAKFRVRGRVALMREAAHLAFPATGWRIHARAFATQAKPDASPPASPAGRLGTSARLDARSRTSQLGVNEHAERLPGRALSA